MTRPQHLRIGPARGHYGICQRGRIWLLAQGRSGPTLGHLLLGRRSKIDRLLCRKAPSSSSLHRPSDGAIGSCCGTQQGSDSSQKSCNCGGSNDNCCYCYGSGVVSASTGKPTTSGGQTGASFLLALPPNPAVGARQKHQARPSSVRRPGRKECRSTDHHVPASPVSVSSPAPSRTVEGAAKDDMPGVRFYSKVSRLPRHLRDVHPNHQSGRKECRSTDHHVPASPGSLTSPAPSSSVEDAAKDDMPGVRLHLEGVETSSSPS